jgi:hypothetical protein
MRVTLAIVTVLVASSPLRGQPINDRSAVPMASLSQCDPVAGGRPTRSVTPRRLYYRFQRDSVAYSGDRYGMSEHGVDVPVFRTVVSCSVSDGAYRYDEAGPGVDVVALCQNSRYMFGRGADGRVYRSLDGETWESLDYHPFGYMFALSDDSLLGTRSLEHLTVERSTDDGVTWTLAVWADSGDDFAWLTPGAWLAPWGFHEAYNGTLVMVEYRLPAGGRYIYRSDDHGASWRMVHDAGELVIDHYHAVTKHEGLNRWVASTGDAMDDMGLVVSDDDGVSWYGYIEAGAVYLQPTYFLDYGHPTRLLFGSDLVWQVGWVDVSDGPDARKLASLITNWDNRMYRSYCWCMFEHNGVYYACNVDGSTNPEQNPVISVSEDLEHWAIYHRFTEGTTVLRFAGEAGGKLHLAVHGGGASASHFAISPAQTRTRAGLVLSPATVNLYDTVATSSAETVAGWVDGSSPGGVFEYAQGIAHHGAGCLHYVRSDGAVIILKSPSIPFEIGETYQARLWMRGTGALALAMWARNYADEGPEVAFGLPQDEWLEVITAPYTVPAGTYNLRLMLRLASTSDNHCEAYIDSLQVEPVPTTPWQLGGVPRSAAAGVSHALVGEEWTNVFSFEPDNLSEYLAAAGDRHLRTYQSDPDNFIELYFDPEDSCFKLRPTFAGIVKPPLLTPPQHFQRRAHVRIAVRHHPDCLSLSVANGRPLETVCSAGPGSLPAGELEVRYGSLDGGDALPCAVFADALYPVYLSDAELDAAVNDLDGVPYSADLDCDGEVNLSDLSILLGAYGGDAGGDMDGDGDTDLIDLSMLLQVYGTVCP